MSRFLFVEGGSTTCSHKALITKLASNRNASKETIHNSFRGLKDNNYNQIVHLMIDKDVDKKIYEHAIKCKDAIVSTILD